MSSNFFSANQGYFDQVVSSIGGSLGGGINKGIGASGSAGVSFSKRDLNELSQNVITQRLMDVTANALTNEAAREELQKEISSMTANNYRYMKSAINEYSRNHIKDMARDTTEKMGNGLKDFDENLKGNYSPPFSQDDYLI